MNDETKAAVRAKAFMMFGGAGYVTFLILWKGALQRQQTTVLAQLFPDRMVHDAAEVLPRFPRE
ncbi:MAG: hypothetical protein KF790_08640 [Steroidobacteraceae bacterium]|nr:hypothetical protein [Steroidobacteraceae bacterium]MCW5572905.1 hypothetical protein [Steroidobacteraceae bacterium]